MKKDLNENRHRFDVFYFHLAAHKPSSTHFFARRRAEKEEKTFLRTSSTSFVSSYNTRDRNTHRSRSHSSFSHFTSPKPRLSAALSHSLRSLCKAAREKKLFYVAHTRSGCEMILFYFLLNRFLHGRSSCAASDSTCCL